MSRSRVLSRAAIVTIVACLLTSTRPAAAGVPGVPALPIATDLSRVAVGAWAEYAVSLGSSSMTIRWAVVGRTRDGTVLEVSVPDGELGKGKRGAIVQRLTVAPSAGAPAVKGAAIQLADTAPLAMPVKAARAQPRLAAPDRKDRVSQESVTVKAGTFTATRYRQATPQGTLEYWVADQASPLGIVKLTLTLPAKHKGAKRRASGPVTVELVKTGRDAKASIVRAPVAIDAKSLAAARAGLGAIKVPPRLTPTRLAPTRPIVPVKVTPRKGNR